MTWPDYVLIADPDSLRLQHYLPELRDFVQSFDPRPKIHIVSWMDLIEADGDLSRWAPAGTFLLRVESPARNFDIFRELLRRGEAELGESPSPWEYDEGWIASPRRLHLGFCRIMSSLDLWASDQSRCWPTSDLKDTQRLFDKNCVSNLLQDKGIGTPEWFQPASVADIYEGMWERGWSQLYVKLAYGSCASGIARVRQLRRNRFDADATIHQKRGRFYNTYHVRTLDGVEMRDALQFLIEQTATAQQAVDKASIHGDGFDVRAVVIAGEVVATVFRASSKPMTNLHLGGYRADPQLCRRTIPDRSWADAIDECRSAAALFDMAALGIDLAFDHRTNQPKILEINSFGDFFPNWRDPSGRTVHRIEIESTARRWGAATDLRKIGRIR